MQLLIDVGINAWAVQLMCESYLRAHGELEEPVPADFFFPVQRTDCAGWKGVRVRLDAERAEDQEPSS